MLELPDVSVLVALMDKLHVHHRVAIEWFNVAKVSGWVTCPLTTSGALRIISRPQQPQGMTLVEARQLLRMLIEANATNHTFWTDRVSLLDEREFDFGKLTGYRQLTDLHLLGLALQNGGTLITLDGGMQQTLNAVRRPTPHLLHVLGEP